MLLAAMANVTISHSKTKTIEDGILACVESCLSVIQQRDGHPFMKGSVKSNK